MNINKDTLIIKLKGAFAFCQQHALILGIAIFGVLYAYIIMQASILINKAPDEAQVSKRLEAVPRPKINQEAVKTIRGLEEQNVNTQAIFKEARDNPFSE